MWVVDPRLEGARVRETGRWNGEWVRDPLAGSYPHCGLDRVCLCISSATLAVAVWDVWVAGRIASTLCVSKGKLGNLLCLFSKF